MLRVRWITCSVPGCDTPRVLLDMNIVAYVPENDQLWTRGWEGPIVNNQARCPKHRRTAPAPS